MGLVIPKSQLPAFQKFLSYDQERLNLLLAALKESKQGLFPDQLTKEISKKIKLDERETKQIVSILLSMYSTRFAHGGSIEAFLKDTFDTLMESSVKPQDEDWTRYKNFFTDYLSLKGQIQVTTKAFDILLGNERNYIDTRIFTDIRPVFTEDPSEEPVGAVLVHNLKIEYRKENSTQEFFVALDSQDLLKLRKVIDRAIAKESSACSLLKKMNLTVAKPDCIE